MIADCEIMFDLLGNFWYFWQPNLHSDTLHQNIYGFF